MSLYDKFCAKVSSDHVRAAIMMSGGGSNARNILTHSNLYPNIDFVSIVTDRSDSQASEIAKHFGIECVCLEGSVKSLKQRDEYFEKLTLRLQQMSIDLLVYAGFMKIVTDSFLNQFPGINSHPADLRIVDQNGNRKYIGMKAVQMALDDELEELRCTCCLVENPVDTGRIIAVSNPLTLSRGDRDAMVVHNRLKEEAEWYYYPLVIQRLSKKEINSSSDIYVFDKLN